MPSKFDFIAKLQDVEARLANNARFDPNAFHADPTSLARVFLEVLGYHSDVQVEQSNISAACRVHVLLLGQVHTLDTVHHHANALCGFTNTLPASQKLTDVQTMDGGHAKAWVYTHTLTAHLLDAIEEEDLLLSTSSCLQLMQQVLTYIKQSIATMDAAALRRGTSSTRSAASHSSASQGSADISKDDCLRALPVALHLHCTLFNNSTDQTAVHNGAHLLRTVSAATASTAEASPFDLQTSQASSFTVHTAGPADSDAAPSPALMPSRSPLVQAVAAPGCQQGQGAPAKAKTKGSTLSHLFSMRLFSTPTRSASSPASAAKANECLHQATAAAGSPYQHIQQSPATAAAGPAHPPLSPTPPFRWGPGVLSKHAAMLLKRGSNSDAHQVSDQAVLEMCHSGVAPAFALWEACMGHVWSQPVVAGWADVPIMLPELLHASVAVGSALAAGAIQVPPAQLLGFSSTHLRRLEQSYGLGVGQVEHASKIFASLVSRFSHLESQQASHPSDGSQQVEKDLCAAAASLVTESRAAVSAWSASLLALDALRQQQKKEQLAVPLAFSDSSTQRNPVTATPGDSAAHPASAHGPAHAAPSLTRGGSSRRTTGPSGVTPGPRCAFLASDTSAVVELLTYALGLQSALEAAESSWLKPMLSSHCTLKLSAAAHHPAIITTASRKGLVGQWLQAQHATMASKSNHRAPPASGVQPHRPAQQHEMEEVLQQHPQDQFELEEDWQHQQLRDSWLAGIHDAPGADGTVSKDTTITSDAAYSLHSSSDPSVTQMRIVDNLAADSFTSQPQTQHTYYLHSLTAAAASPGPLCEGYEGSSDGGGYNGDDSSSDDDINGVGEAFAGGMADTGMAQDGQGWMAGSVVASSQGHLMHNSGMEFGLGLGHFFECEVDDGCTDNVESGVGEGGAGHGLAVATDYSWDEEDELDLPLSFNRRGKGYHSARRRAEAAVAAPWSSNASLTPSAFNPGRQDSRAHSQSTRASRRQGVDAEADSQGQQVHGPGTHPQSQEDLDSHVLDQDGDHDEADTFQHASTGNVAQERGGPMAGPSQKSFRYVKSMLGVLRTASQVVTKAGSRKAKTTPTKGKLGDAKSGRSAHAAAQYAGSSVFWGAGADKAFAIASAAEARRVVFDSMQRVQTLSRLLVSTADSSLCAEGVGGTALGRAGWRQLLGSCMTTAQDLAVTAIAARAQLKACGVRHNGTLLRGRNPLLVHLKQLAAAGLACTQECKQLLLVVTGHHGLPHGSSWGSNSCSRTSLPLSNLHHLVMSVGLSMPDSSDGLHPWQPHSASSQRPDASGHLHSAATPPSATVDSSVAQMACSKALRMCARGAAPLHAILLPLRLLNAAANVFDDEDLTQQVGAHVQACLDALAPQLARTIWIAALTAANHTPPAPGIHVTAAVAGTTTVTAPVDPTAWAVAAAAAAGGPEDVACQMAHRFVTAVFSCDALTSGCGVADARLNVAGMVGTHLAAAQAASATVVLGKLEQAGDAMLLVDVQHAVRCCSTAGTLLETLEHHRHQRQPHIQPLVHASWRDIWACVCQSPAGVLAPDASHGDGKACSSGLPTNVTRSADVPGAASGSDDAHLGGGSEKASDQTQDCDGDVCSGSSGSAPVLNVASATAATSPAKLNSAAAPGCSQSTTEISDSSNNANRVVRAVCDPMAVHTLGSWRLDLLTGKLAATAFTTPVTQAGSQGVPPGVGDMQAPAFPQHGLPPVPSMGRMLLLSERGGSTRWGAPPSFFQPAPPISRLAPTSHASAGGVSGGGVVGAGGGGGARGASAGGAFVRRLGAGGGSSGGAAPTSLHTGAGRATEIPTTPPPHPHPPRGRHRATGSLGGDVCALTAAINQGAYPWAATPAPTTTSTTTVFTTAHLHALADLGGGLPALEAWGAAVMEEAEAAMTHKLFTAMASVLNRLGPPATCAGGSPQPPASQPPATQLLADLQACTARVGQDAWQELLRASAILGNAAAAIALLDMCLMERGILGGMHAAACLRLKAHPVGCIVTTPESDPQSLAAAVLGMPLPPLGLCPLPAAFNSDSAAAAAAVNPLSQPPATAGGALEAVGRMFGAAWSDMETRAATPKLMRRLGAASAAGQTRLQMSPEGGVWAAMGAGGIARVVSALRVACALHMEGVTRSCVRGVGTGAAGVGSGGGASGGSVLWAGAEDLMESAMMGLSLLLHLWQQGPVSAAGDELAALRAAAARDQLLQHEADAQLGCTTGCGVRDGGVKQGGAAHSHGKAQGGAQAGLVLQRVLACAGQVEEVWAAAQAATRFAADAAAQAWSSGLPSRPSPGAAAATSSCVPANAGLPNTLPQQQQQEGVPHVVAAPPVASKLWPHRGELTPLPCVMACPAPPAAPLSHNPPTTYRLPVPLLQLQPAGNVYADSHRSCVNEVAQGHSGGGGSGGGRLGAAVGKGGGVGVRGNVLAGVQPRPQQEQRKRDGDSVARCSHTATVATSAASSWGDDVFDGDGGLT